MNSITDNLMNSIQKCRVCKTISGYEKFSKSSHGQLQAKYLLVSEAPGKASLDREKYWTGVGGQILRSCMVEANTTLENLFYLTDIVKCWPNKNKKNRAPYHSEIENCSHFLTREIDELKPELILSFGKIVSSFLLNRDVKVKKEHGYLYDYSKETKILVLLHPTGIDRHMNRNIYTKQLTSMFKKLIEGELNEIAEIFNSK